MSMIKKIVLGSYVLSAICVLLTSGFNDALAQEPVRYSFPIVAGTVLRYPHSYCTAGLVLQQTGLFRRISNYQRALRFVLTAGHCGNVHDAVSVGDLSAGSVVWKSRQFDLELVRIEPTATRRVVCGAPSTGLHCSIVHEYTPRAIGQVILGSLRTRADGPVPVIGTGSPSNTEVFCTSGAYTGVMCTWGVEQGPGWQHTVTTQFKYAETAGSNVIRGDSGGPVVSTSGTIYGIISAYGRPDTEYANVMSYNSIDQFFSEQRGYSLAPAN